MRKRFVILFVCFFIIQISIKSSNACSISELPLRKQFRIANSVFVGRVSKVIEYKPTDKELLSVPENWRDWTVWSKVTFEVEKKWKGNFSKQQEFIAVAYYICGCSATMSQFKEGEKYLSFSQGKNFVSICDSEESETETAEKKLKRIDNFGFRFWSVVYPF
jgi:hypothetical protein